jgi:hypothetical protein
MRVDWVICRRVRGNFVRVHPCEKPCKHLQSVVSRGQASPARPPMDNGSHGGGGTLTLLRPHCGGTTRGAFLGQQTTFGRLQLGVM